MCRNCNCDRCWICGKRPLRVTLSGGGDVLTKFNQTYEVAPHRTYVDNGDYRHEGYFSVRNEIVFIPNLIATLKGVCSSDWRWYTNEELRFSSYTEPAVVVYQQGEGSVFGAGYVPAMGLQYFYFWLHLGNSDSQSRYAMHSNSRAVVLDMYAQYRLFATDGVFGTIVGIRRRELYRVDMPENCRSIEGPFEMTRGSLQFEGGPADIFTPIGHPPPPSILNPDPNFSIQVEF